MVRAGAALDTRAGRRLGLLRDVTTSTDKRRHARRTLAVEFRTRDTDGKGSLELSGADLSAGGAFLVSEGLLEPGDTLSLEFLIPGRPTARRAAARGGWGRRFPSPGQTAGGGGEGLRVGGAGRQ